MFGLRFRVASARTCCITLCSSKPLGLSSEWFRILLVGGDWNMTFIFPYIGKNHPNWQIFFRGVQTTTQFKDSERFGLKGPERLLTSFEGTLRTKLTMLVAQRQGSDIPDKQRCVSDVMWVFPRGSQEEADALGGLLKQRRPIIAAKSLMFYRLATFTMPSSGCQGFTAAAPKSHRHYLSTEYFVRSPGHGCALGNVTDGQIRYDKIKGKFLMETKCCASGSAMCDDIFMVNGCASTL